LLPIVLGIPHVVEVPVLGEKDGAVAALLGSVHAGTEVVGLNSLCAAYQHPVPAHSLEEPQRVVITEEIVRSVSSCVVDSGGPEHRCPLLLALRAEWARFAQDEHWRRRTRKTD
jgi:hypothetical protein